MYLLRRFGATTGNDVVLGSRSLLVGRSPESDLVLDDPQAPELAARVTVHGSDVMVDVLRPGSVRVNGRKAKSGPLLCGDRIEIGETVLMLDSKDVLPLVAASGAGPGPVLETFSRFAEAVGRERDLKTLLRKIIEILFEIVGGEEAFIFQVDDEGKPRVFVSSSDERAEERFSDTVVQNVLQTGTAVCIPNALADPQFAGSKSIADLKLTTVLCCPISIAGTTVGVIYLGSQNPSVSFGQDNLNALRLYALMAGMLINHVAYIAQQHSTIRRLAELKGDLDMVAEAPIMKALFSQVDAVAGSDIAVLLHGETGTGKDVVAQLIHRRSGRHEGKFVPVNCSSLRGELLESELFGHRKGAFTGAIRDHDGLFLSADGGTLFLDEISEMDISLQAKLLRTLESGMIRPVGSSIESPVNVRIICATNRDLKKMVDDGAFRHDLFFRLNQFAITLPPLRDRGNDIALLAYFFLEKFKSLYPNKKIADFHPDSLKTMMFYDWPGNVRELTSVVHKGVLSASDSLVRLDIASPGVVTTSFDDATKEFQGKLITRALNACNGNREAATRLLGMSRSSFFRYLAEIEK